MTKGSVYNKLYDLKEYSDSQLRDDVSKPRIKTFAPNRKLFAVVVLLIFFFIIVLPWYYGVLIVFTFWLLLLAVGKGRAELE